MIGAPLIDKGCERFMSPADQGLESAALLRVGKKAAQLDNTFY
jgi:hypothetical protein